MNVLVVTNMYPTEAEPWFGSFVRAQVEDLRTLGLDVEVLTFDGRHHARAAGRAARRTGQPARTRRVDIVQAPHGRSGAVALAQRAAPVVHRLHGAGTGGAG